MRTTTINQKILALGRSLPEQDWFDRVGDLTALRGSEADGFYRSNYDRGPLLYSLIAARRPTTVLEFGTGRGYGTVCMAKAMVDHKIDGQIFTVDVLGFNDRQTWPINRGFGPAVEMLSAADVWNRHFETALLDRINRLTGDSGTLAEEWRQRDRPKPDFGFIDAGHRYEEVRHDYFTFLSICSPRPVILFDDYSTRPDFGVKRLVDTEVASGFNIELLRTEWRAGDATGNAEKESEGMALVESVNDQNGAPRGPSSDAVERQLINARRRLRILRAKDQAKSFLRPIARVWRTR